MDTTLEKLKKDLLNIPSKIKEYECSLLELNKELSTKEIQMKLVKNTLTREIWSNEQYTNEKSRETELQSRLSKDIQYKEYKSEYIELLRKKNTSEIEFNYLRRTNQNLYALALIMKKEVL